MNTAKLILILYLVLQSLSMEICQRTLLFLTDQPSPMQGGRKHPASRIHLVRGVSCSNADAKVQPFIHIHKRTQKKKTHRLQAAQHTHYNIYMRERNGKTPLETAAASDRDCCCFRRRLLLLPAETAAASGGDCCCFRHIIRVAMEGVKSGAVQSVLV